MFAVLSCLFLGYHAYFGTQKNYALSIFVKSVRKANKRPKMGIAPKQCYRKLGGCFEDLRRFSDISAYIWDLEAEVKLWIRSGETRNQVLLRKP